MTTSLSRLALIRTCLATIVAALIATPSGAQENDYEVPVNRRDLPIAAPWQPPIHTLDARDAKAPPVFEVKAPKDAPNVMIILIDDLGFGGTSAFGGVTQTPSFDRLAKNGLMYNQFHSTALCSPTRQALLTGRNHHSVNMGSITEIATSFPGQTGKLPESCAKLPETLRLNGYSTAHFGKCHEVAAWEISPSGPLTRWPTLSGFDKFYGFLGGETNQWSPAIYDGVTPVDDPAKGDPDYHFMNDMTTQAINWVRSQQSLTPDKPFFVYFAPGATHAPHHVPQSYIDKHKGAFDEGWDVIRKRIFENQKRLGVIPADAELADKPKDIKDWDDLSDDERKLFSRQAEVFAAFLDMTDAEIGRLIDAVEKMGELDNTLIVFMAGDNGTSAEGGMIGMYNEMTYFNGVEETVPDMLKHYDEWGGPSTYPHMAAGWAVCFDSPFMWTKQVPANYGGTRQGTVVHWPNGIKAKGELRDQWHHVIDIAPTILEAAGLPQPRTVNGVGQRPMEGVSMAYSFDDAEAADRHLVQYFEIMGNRGLYYDGWFAGTVHMYPWAPPRNTFENDDWELYHVTEDFSMANNLADERPEKLKELQEMFLSEAVKYKVLPLDDRRQLRVNAKLAGRPTLMGDRKSLTVYEGLGFLPENDFIDTKNTSFEIVAQIDNTEGDAAGVIVSQGGRFGGWSLYVQQGKPVYTYNFLGLDSYTIKSDEALPKKQATIKLEFDYAGQSSDGQQKLGAGGTATLLIDGKKVGSGKVEKTQFAIWSADETANVGVDRETPVSSDYDEHSSRFTGKIDKVTITLEQ
ncbi:Arylsulfatase [Posidoniimonas polymericola]|uniref:Arylsulfatase n=1 Tax=Posidoniimonas polymericola TaxID=2528002 RepID=A0A5C5XYT1_9BACT|nr:arylsulfatase [Posidoniimonas polymericola]TWT67699.1 Arylsulfatase [Posidoniimonas polymericola]